MASVHPKFTDWHQSFSTESFWLMWWLWFQNFHFIDGLHFESDRYQSTMPFVSSGTSWIYNLRWHSYRKWIISISFPFVWPSQAFCKDVLLRFLVGTSDGYLNSVTSCFYFFLFFFHYIFSDSSFVLILWISRQVGIRHINLLNFILVIIFLIYFICFVCFLFFCFFFQAKNSSIPLPPLDQVELLRLIKPHRRDQHGVREREREYVDLLDESESPPRIAWRRWRSLCNRTKCLIFNTDRPGLSCSLLAA